MLNLYIHIFPVFVLKDGADEKGVTNLCSIQDAKYAMNMQCRVLKLDSFQDIEGMYGTGNSDINRSRCKREYQLW